MIKISRFLSDTQFLCISFEESKINSKIEFTKIYMREHLTRNLMNEFKPKVIVESSLQLRT